MRRHAQIKMVASDQTSGAHKKYLNHRVAVVRCKRDHILILAVAGGDLLLLRDLLHTRQKLPLLDRRLKIQPLRRLVHTLLQHFQHRLVVSVQELNRLRHALCVVLAALIALTGRLTLFNMIIQAGALFSDIPRQNAIAGTQPIELINQLDGILDSARAGIRSEVARLVLFHCTRKKHPRKRLAHRHLDKRIRLIVFQHGVVFRAMLLDQIALQHQRLQLGVGDDVLKAADLRHHLLDFYALIAAALKILAHPVFQTDCFADVDNRILFVVHNINSRLCREFF